MSPTRAFADLLNSYLDVKWHLDPVEASAAGLTKHDHLLGSYGTEDIARHLAALKSLTGALEECEVDDPDDEIDQTALLNDARVTIHRLETERPHVRDPTFWVSHALESLYVLLVQQDRTGDQRAQATRARLIAMPGLLDTARATLRDCPRVFVETAIDVSEAGSSLIDDVAREVRPVGDESFGEACTRAREALGSFGRHLRDHLLPQATDAFACGEATFNFRLQYQHLLPTTAAELWGYGHALVDDVEQELGELAEQIAPGVPWPELTDRLRGDHPTADDLIASYAAAMERARRFVEAHGLVSIPPGALHVVETPTYLRSLIPFAAYQPPGAFSTDKTGWFYVTPPDAEASAEAVEAMLRDHCTHDVACTALHEGYPGHHLHFLHAQAQPRVARAVVGTSVTVEGWALYCEEMMGKAGFYRTVEERFFQKLALLWRAVRIVADVGLHTRGLSFDEGVQLLVDRIHFERGNAESEVRRYCAHPTYQMGYAVGRREIDALHRAYRRAVGPDYALRQFHERLLSHGLLPVSLMRWGMGLHE